MWSIFKIVRRREDHTGGGDGDDGTDLEDNGPGDTEEGEGAAGAKKRKKGVGKTKVRYTKNVLDTFQHSIFYPIIDAV